MIHRGGKPDFLYTLGHILSTVVADRNVFSSSLELDFHVCASCAVYCSASSKITQKAIGGNLAAHYSMHYSTKPTYQMYTDGLEVRALVPVRRRKGDGVVPARVGVDQNVLVRPSVLDPALSALQLVASIVEINVLPRHPLQPSRHNFLTGMDGRDGGVHLIDHACRIHVEALGRKVLRNNEARVRFLNTASLLVA